MKEEIYMKYEILNALDRVDTMYIESDIEILDALTDAYERASVVLEQYEEMELFTNLQMFQEGEILDKAMGNKYENMLIRILKFIPRLLIATAEAIAKAFNQKEMQPAEDGIASAENIMNNGTPEEKHNLITYVNNNSDGQLKMNEDGTFETPNFKVGIIGHLEFLKSSRDLMKRIKEEMDVNKSTSYKDLADHINNIINGREQITEDTAKLTFTALKQAMKDIVSLAPVLTETIGVIGNKLNKEIAEMEQNGNASQEDIQKQKEARQLLATVQKWSKMITTGNTVIKVVKKVFGIGKFLDQDINPFNNNNQPSTPQEKQDIIDARREQAAQQRDEQRIANRSQDDEETKKKKLEVDKLKATLAKKQTELSKIRWNKNKREALQRQIDLLTNQIQTIENEIATTSQEPSTTEPE